MSPAGSASPSARASGCVTVHRGPFLHGAAADAGGGGALDAGDPGVALRSSTTARVSGRVIVPRCAASACARRLPTGGGVDAGCRAARRRPHRDRRVDAAADQAVGHGITDELLRSRPRSTWWRCPAGDRPHADPRAAPCAVAQPVGRASPVKGAFSVADAMAPGPPMDRRACAPFPAATRVEGLPSQCATSGDSDAAHHNSRRPGRSCNEPEPVLGSGSRAVRRRPGWKTSL